MTTHPNKRNKEIHGTAKGNLEGKKASPAHSHGFASLVLIIASFLFITIIAVSAQSGWFSLATSRAPTAATLSVPKDATSAEAKAPASTMPKEPTSGKETAKISSAAAATAPVIQGNNSGRQAIESESITLRPTGFEPAFITRPAGRFLLMVDNRSGSPVMTLQLDKQAGASTRLRDVRIPREELDWSDVVDLHPGSYILTEAAHPERVCHITITAP